MSEDKSKLQLIGEIAQANNKNLELIEELNNKEEEIERLNNIIDNAIKYAEKMSYQAIVDNPKKDLIKILKKEK